MFDIYSVKNQTLKQILILFFVTRPVFFLVSFLMLVAGFIYSKASLSIEFYLLLFILVLLNHIIYGLNDIYDYETDKLNPRKGLWHGLILKKKYHDFVKKSVLISSAIIFISLFFFNYYTKYLILVLVFFGYSYSCPPIRAKGRFFLDVIYSSIGYPLFILLGYSLGGDLNISDKFYWVFLMMIGFTLHSILYDYDSDKKAKIKTTAVILGKRLTSFLSFLSFFVIFLFGNFSTTIIYYFFIWVSLLTLISVFYSKRIFLRIQLFLIYFSLGLLILYFFISWIPRFL